MIPMVPHQNVNLSPALAAATTLNQNWQVAPFCVPHDRVLEANRALSMFENSNCLKPSIIAQLPPGAAGKCSTVQIVDEAFTTSLENYQSLLADAAIADRAIFGQPTGSDSMDFCRAIATYAYRFSRVTPNVPVIKHIVGPVLLFFGGIYGMFQQSSVAEERKKEAASANRNQWLNEVSVREKIRIESAIKAINQRTKIIKRDIEDLGDLIDDNLVDELRLLDLFMNSISPTTPLRISNQSVSQYLQARGIPDSNLIPQIRS